jgi:DNA-directed RNA polymerase specialized sigma24 family protein
MKHIYDERGMPGKGRTEFIKGARTFRRFRVLRHSVAVYDLRLCDALSQIDKTTRNVLLMLFWLNMSEKEISDETGIPLPKLDSLIACACAELRKLLEDKGCDANDFFHRS